MPPAAGLRTTNASAIAIFMVKRPIRWEWDQGRQSYTNDFTTFVGLARGLFEVRGQPVNKQAGVDALRPALQLSSGQQFKPVDDQYPLWRNYGRIFKSLLLASEDPHRSLVTTDVCNYLAANNFQDKPWSVDEFLTFLAPRYYQPSPSRAYAPNAPKVFPICALLRYLAINEEITLDEIFDLLIGNGVEGNEPTGFYKALNPSKYSPANDEKRQVREFVEYVAQLSFVSFEQGVLSMNPAILAPEARDIVFKLATPDKGPFHLESADEIVRLGRLAQPSALIPQQHLFQAQPAVPPEIIEREFLEGSSKARTHLIRERDPKIRRAFFANAAGTVDCEVCNLKPGIRYPWTAGQQNKKSLIEIHHVLPLSSKAHSGSTDLADLHALCPSCHRAIHRFYSIWLKRNSVDDFKSKKIAKRVFDEARALHQP
jgi:hypothetical protein